MLSWLHELHDYFTCNNIFAANNYGSYLKGFALALLESVTEKVEKVTSVVYWFIGLFVFALFGKINELLSYPLCNILYTFRY